MDYIHKIPGNGVKIKSKEELGNSIQYKWDLCLATLQNSDRYDVLEERRENLQYSKHFFKKIKFVMLMENLRKNYNLYISVVHSCGEGVKCFIHKSDDYKTVML